MGDVLKVLVIGAHPDDPDIRFGGTAAKLAAKGARVRFVSLCNGNMGHHEMAPKELAARRQQETQRAAAIFGVEEYAVWNNGDCTLMPTLALRAQVTRLIRRFAPNMVFTHRTCDYHADHRAVATLVQDAMYLLGVPHWCADVPRPKMLPSLWYLTDEFTLPRPLRADLKVDVTPYAETMLDALSCHVSQVFEWLPYDNPAMGEAPKPSDRAGCHEFLTRNWLEAMKRRDAKRFDVAGVKYAEVFEWGEYGRKATAEELEWF